MKKSFFEELEWHEDCECSILKSKENSMICAELYRTKVNDLFHSEIWIYKVGREFFSDDSVDLVKFKTEVKTIEMIKEMKRKLTESNLKDFDYFYLNEIPCISKRYFFGP